MARYTGPTTRIARKFGEAIFGDDKSFEKRNYPPGQHGMAKKRGKKSEYAVQLMEKQKAKYTYGVLEKQFRKTFEEAARIKGVTGENLIKLLEARLDNAVYRLGLSPSRPGARQLVSHKHITVNGSVVNIPSYQLQPGDIIAAADLAVRVWQLLGDDVIEWAAGDGKVWLLQSRCSGGTAECPAAGRSISSRRFAVRGNSQSSRKSLLRSSEPGVRDGADLCRFGLPKGRRSAGAGFR